MPNLRGPDEKRRRLFANVVLSVILYGALVWGNALDSTTKNRAIFSPLERMIAQRVISAYRTVSNNAALLLARTPPIRLLAPMRKRIYEKLKNARERGEYSADLKNAIKQIEVSKMRDLWREYLEKPNTPGEYTKMAVVPRMERWLDHETGSMSFHLTQLMTGHGCFRRFLWRIGRRNTAECDFCGDEQDDAVHTLRNCEAWESPRNRFLSKLNLPVDFTLGDVVDSIIESRDSWVAFSAFAEEVMGRKEEEERRREMLENLPSPSATPSDRDGGPDASP